MTKPTPAQIEAAAEALQKLAEELNPPLTFPYSKKRNRMYAEAALTAAVEAGETENYWKECYKSVRPKIDEIEADTIERCAQVAVDWRGWLPGNREPKPEEIAAAIRKLKDPK